MQIQRHWRSDEIVEPNACLLGRIILIFSDHSDCVQTTNFQFSHIHARFIVVNKLLLTNKQIVQEWRVTSHILRCIPLDINMFSWPWYNPYILRSSRLHQESKLVNFPISVILLAIFRSYFECQFLTRHQIFNQTTRFSESGQKHLKFVIDDPEDRVALEAFHVLRLGPSEQGGRVWAFGEIFSETGWREGLGKEMDL